MRRQRLKVRQDLGPSFLVHRRHRLVHQQDTRIGQERTADRHALALVARSEAPLGIVYETDAKVEPAVKIVAVFPEDSHDPIVYPAAIVAASKNPAAAKFVAYLSGAAAGAIFEHYGFRLIK